MTQISRRRIARWAAVATLGSLLAAAGAPAQAADTLRVGRAQATPFSFTPIDMGIETGIFAKHGLKIERSAFRGDAKMQQAMAADSIDIGIGSGPGMAFMAKGIPAKGVAAMAHQPLLLGLVVGRDTGINSIKDLKGKRIGCSTVSSLTYWLPSELSRQQGWGVGGIKITPLGSPQAQVAALKAKQIEGMSTSLGIAYTLERKGEAKLLLRWGDFVKPFHIHVIFATDKTRKERPEVLRRFLVAWFETIKWMRGHKKEAVEISRKVTRLPPDIASRVYDEVVPMFSDDGKFNKEAVDKLRRSYVQLKILKEEPPASVLYTEEFLPKL